MATCNALVVVKEISTWFVAKAEDCKSCQFFSNEQKQTFLILNDSCPSFHLRHCCLTHAMNTDNYKPPYSHSKHQIIYSAQPIQQPNKRASFGICSFVPNVGFSLMLKALTYLIH